MRYPHVDHDGDVILEFIVNEDKNYYLHRELNELIINSEIIKEIFDYINVFIFKLSDEYYSSLSAAIAAIKIQLPIIYNIYDAGYYHHPSRGLVLVEVVGFGNKKKKKYLPEIAAS